MESEGFVFHDAVLRFLAEFGGLSFDPGGKGIEVAVEPASLEPTNWHRYIGFPPE